MKTAILSSLIIGAVASFGFAGGASAKTVKLEVQSAWPLTLPASGREWAGVLMALVPAAALEELLFRSLPLAGLTWLVSPWWLLWPLALLFGFLHWPQGWWGVVGTALAAMALSALFLVSGHIWVPLIAHYTMNVLQLVLAARMGVRPLRAPFDG